MFTLLLLSVKSTDATQVGEGATLANNLNDTQMRDAINILKPQFYEDPNCSSRISQAHSVGIIHDRRRLSRDQSGGDASVDGAKSPPRCPLSAVHANSIPWLTLTA